MTCYIHSVPGRLRVKIPAIKEQPEKARAIQTLLECLDGIHNIRTNTVTGSIVVKYESGRSLREEILSTLEENGYFEKTGPVKRSTSIFESTSEASRALSKAFCGWAVGRALEGTGLSFLAAFI